jgi:hypothetical protein
MFQINKTKIKIKATSLVIKRLRELIPQKMVNNCQAGRETAQMFAIFKINTQMKRLPVDYSKFSSIMISRLGFKKFILLTAFLTLIQC